jgi:hypothetical protein
VRVFTLKNAAWLALSVAVLFLIFSTYMERRSHGTSSYGRLYERRIDVADAPKPRTRPEIIREAPTETVAAPAAVEDDRGEEILGVTASEPPATETTVSPSPALPRAHRGRREGGRVTITGVADGVRLDIQPAPPPRQ